MAATNPDDVRMSLGDHLEELRKRLFLGLIGPVVAGVALLFYATDLIAILCAPLIESLEAAGQPPGVYTGEVGAPFMMYLKVAFVGGLIIGIPWLGYQLWLFVAPALFPHERKLAVYLMPFSALLASIGVAFMYFVALPFSLWFLIGFVNWYPMPEGGSSLVGRFIAPPRVIEGPTAAAPLQLPRLAEDPVDPPDGSIWVDTDSNTLRMQINGRVRRVRLDAVGLVTHQQNLAEYISFVVFFALAFAITFQTPLVMLGLGYTNVMDYRTMRRGWRIVALGCVILGSVLTPPDLASMAALAIPMYLLYEFGLLLVRLLAPGKKAEAGGGGE